MSNLSFSLVHLKRKYLSLKCFVWFEACTYSLEQCGIYLHQRKYGTDVLKKFNILGCNSAATQDEAGIKLRRKDILRNHLFMSLSIDI
jgi:hypothetical protein